MTKAMSMRAECFREACGWSGDVTEALLGDDDVLCPKCKASVSLPDYGSRTREQAVALVKANLQRIGYEPPTPPSPKDAMQLATVVQPLDESRQVLQITFLRPMSVEEMNKLHRQINEGLAGLAHEPCERCGGIGRLTIYDTATYIGQPCSPIGDEPCPDCSAQPPRFTELPETTRVALREKARRNGAACCEHLSDEWVANEVRMLMRNDLAHEAICTAARDRIMKLSLQLEQCRSAMECNDPGNARAIFGEPRK